MAVPKKKRSKSKKGSHFANFLKNFKSIANSKNSLITVLKNKFSTNFLFIKSKINLKFFNSI
jgi:ribosomal protein L32